MKKSFLGFVIFFSVQSCAQYPEFAKSDNGLIYSENTVKQLKYIVDSLNIKFRVCDLHKVYRAKAQAKANYISLDKGDIKAAVRDIKNNISYAEFVKKYSKTDAEKDLLVVRFFYKDYDDNDKVQLSAMDMGENDEYEISFNEKPGQFKTSVKDQWIFNYREKTEYSNEAVDAFYFTTEFIASPLPDKYARMVQYADCMVDTTVEIFNEKAKRTGLRHYKEGKSNVTEFLEYINSKTDRPGYPEEYTEAKYAKYEKEYRIWDSLRLEKVDKMKNDDVKFNELFQAALKDALDDASFSNDVFEEYAGRYDSPKTALELKRGRIVVGGCSQDNSPRVHAMNIALLSAETINWEIFLRSHLDIMNDNFERVSDGSYAWGARKTYIKELEVLDINVTDLLLGISLRIENPGEHHYYGSIGRLGRALSESHQREQIETKMLDMIRDEKLDDYNRVLIYYLYLNYNHYIEDKEAQKENITNLRSAIHTLPGYLSSRVKFEDD